MFTTIHWNNIASISDDCSILNRTTIEEVSDYHWGILKLVIKEINKRYNQLVLQDQQHNKMKSVISHLKFWLKDSLNIVIAYMDMEIGQVYTYHMRNPKFGLQVAARQIWIKKYQMVSLSFERQARIYSAVYIFILKGYIVWSHTDLREDPEDTGVWAQPC